MYTIFLALFPNFFWVVKTHRAFFGGSGSMSAFLLNAMNAVAARFAPSNSSTPARKPQEYIEAAWTLAMPLMRLPSRDIAAGLLLLSWAEFGEVSYGFHVALNLMSAGLDIRVIMLIYSLRV